MRLVVFGPTGGTGRALIEQALADGHRVTAFARRPAALVIRHDRFTAVAGDALDPAAVAGAVAGQDAVVSTLGIGYSRAATTVYSAGTGHILAAMRAAGVGRLLCVSTASLDLPGRAAPVQHLIYQQVLHRMLARPYADMALMEQAVRASALDWTLVRAARLTNGRRTGRYRVAAARKLPGGWSISRPDLAHYLLHHLVDPDTYRAVVEIAY